VLSISEVFFRNVCYRQIVFLRHICYLFVCQLFLYIYLKDIQPSPGLIMSARHLKAVSVRLRKSVLYTYFINSIYSVWSFVGSYEPVFSKTS
jgi:hypothetical protein